MLPLDGSFCLLLFLLSVVLSIHVQHLSSVHSDFLNALYITVNSPATAGLLLFDVCSICFQYSEQLLDMADRAQFNCLPVKSLSRCLQWTTKSSGWF
jgi:hypothetical protein